jgi:biotin transport system substrate-specific component
MTAATYPARRGERIVLADLLPGSLVRDTVLVASGAALTGVAAQVSIHTSLTPVPFTLQTLSVLVVGGALGAVRGVLSMLVYMVAGVAGVPWFASHSHGWGGPTFGYIIGFVVAAAVVGALARRGNDRAVLSTIGLMSLGNAVIYAIGATWLAHDLHLSAAKAIELGVTPFLLSDAAKIAIAALAFPAAWRLAGRWRI